MQRGKIYLSIAEEEIVRHLAHYMINDMGKEETTAEIDAVNEVVKQKRELAFDHGRRGNLALARHIKKELDEWTKEDEAQFIEIERKLKEIKK
jgi:uncharacterized protein YwgA